MEVTQILRSMGIDPAKRKAWMTDAYLQDVAKQQEIEKNTVSNCPCCSVVLPRETVEPMVTQLAETLQQAEQQPLPEPEPVAAPAPTITPPEAIRQQQQEVEAFMAELETPSVPFESVVRRMQTAHDDVLRQMADSLFENGDGANESLRQDFLNDLAAYWVFLQSMLE